MKNLIRLGILSFCILIFASCSKKSTENFTPTDTYHPPKTMTNGIKKSSTKPTTKEGVFWIGSSMNHEFVIEAGSISLSGVYAINNKENLEKDVYGNLQFYPKKSLADLEFFKSEIGNLDYVEGTYYQVEGTKYYIGSELWGVIVNSVLQRVDAQPLGRVEKEIVNMASASKNSKTAEKSKKFSKGKEEIIDFTPTETWHPPVEQNSSNSKVTQKTGVEGSSETKREVTSSSTETRTIKRTKTNARWQNSKSKSTKSQVEPKVMVSSNPPAIRVGTFWISSSRNHTYSTETGAIGIGDSYALLEVEELPRSASGALQFYPKDVDDVVFFDAKIDNFSYQEGYYYKVEATLGYLGNEVTSIKVTNVLGKIKDRLHTKGENKTIYQDIGEPETSFTPTDTQHPERNDIDSGKKDKVAKSTSKTTRTTKRWQNSKRKTTVRQEEPKVMVSSDPPSVLDGIFWIGSSRDHSFSMEVGAVSVADAYAINISHVQRSLSGELTQFYPIENMESFEFFDGKINNLDYEEGNYYKVVGSLQYRGNKLTGVSVDRVLEKVKDRNFTKSSKEDIPTVDPTQTWHPPATEDSDPDGISWVSPDPPSIYVGKFWIVADRSGSYSSAKGGLYRYEDSYLITNRENLEKNSDGELMVYNGDQSALIFFGGDIDGFDFKEGMLYQVEGSQHYLGNQLEGIQVDKVLQKVKKFTTHISWTEEEAMGKDSEGTWMVSSDPPKVILDIYWINSAKNGVLRTNNGPMAYSNCFVVNSIPKLEESPYGDMIFFNGDASTIEFHCDGIEGLDFEEGFYHKVSAQSYKTKNGENALRVYEVLDRIEDKDFVKIEEMILHIGPGKAKGYAFTGQELECMQVQYDKYSRSKEWGAYCGSIPGFEPEPGYQYTIKIKRTHKSKRESEMVMDDFTLNDELITILRKRRIM